MRLENGVSRVKGARHTSQDLVVLVDVFVVLACHVVLTLFDDQDQDQFCSHTLTLRKLVKQ